MDNLIIKFKSRSGVYQFKKNGTKYISINPGSEFRIYLKNEFNTPIDVEIGFDNSKIGTWRIAPDSEIILVRPGLNKPRFSMISTETVYYFKLIKPKDSVISKRKKENNIKTKNKIIRRPEYAWGRQPYSNEDLDYTKVKFYKLTTVNQKGVPRMAFSDPYLYKNEPEEYPEQNELFYSYANSGITLTN